MKLTKSQQNELEVWKYFMPSDCKWLSKTEDDIKKFFEKSEKGLHKSEGGTVPSASGDFSYFNALCWGKIWAGRHWQMYEEGVMEGTMSYFTILGGNDEVVNREWWQFWKPKFWVVSNPIPRPVVEQMKKEMFKGIDSERIEKCYQNILLDKINNK